MKEPCVVAFVATNRKILRGAMTGERRSTTSASVAELSTATKTHRQPGLAPIVLSGLLPVPSGRRRLRDQKDGSLMSNCATFHLSSSEGTGS